MFVVERWYLFKKLAKTWDALFQILSLLMEGGETLVS